MPDDEERRQQWLHEWKVENKDAIVMTGLFILPKLAMAAMEAEADHWRSGAQPDLSTCRVCRRDVSTDRVLIEAAGALCAECERATTQGAELEERLAAADAAYKHVWQALFGEGTRPGGAAAMGVSIKILLKNRDEARARVTELEEQIISGDTGVLRRIEILLERVKKQLDAREGN